MAEIRKFPLDLLFVAGLVLLTDTLVLVPSLSDSLLRTRLGIFLVLFLPSYALTEAIFPTKKDLQGSERAVISLGLSIAVVPIMGLFLNYTTSEIGEIPILTALSVFTLLIFAVAYYRRSLLPATEAFEVPFKASFLSMKTETFEKAESKVDRILAVLLVFSILASIGGLAYILGNPKEGEHFTEFYILGANRTVENYPTEFIKGESGTVFVGIVNHEYRPINYTMEIRLENHSLPLPENQRQVILAHNEIWEEPVIFTPPFEGEYMKLEFLLFNETEKTAPYRDLHLWINVTEEAREA